ncbi:YcaO-like family protein [Actinoallomurus rhizosphaericola]|uniref:YcaO-like family protein n=1 Tax=Actinoallomurus rhizosphaericola TaxID=2952536 RepID=UPI0020911915|nr:YcaO-like family protein [Actinoallomurus rhizosphaericola]MCO5991790.1 YcaO-like family protein [Actinoallomurus rhizosphaericola]
MGQGSALLDLAGPYGAVGRPRRVNTYGWMPNECVLYTASTGNPSAVTGPFRADARVGHGTGRAYGDADRARLLAVAEALERYSGLVAPERGVVVASAAELGDDALDLDLIARCSPRELRRSGCPVHAPDRTRPIRWTEAVNLRTGRPVLVPAVLVFLTFPELAAENFWIPISTGCAVHRTVEAAMVNALCELIERDALALTWLLRRPLPRLAEDRLPDSARSILAWCADHGIESFLYDATTDVGVPVVYCLQTAEHTSRTGQLVGAACGFDGASLTEHALLEAMGLRLGIESRPAPPRRYADHRVVDDGAAVMAARARREAFGFLRGDLPPSRPAGDLSVSHPAGERPASHPAGALPASGPAGGLSAFHSVGGDPGSDRARLEFLLRRLAELDMTVLMVDLTTRELRDSGHVAVRVIVPELQPMSARPLVQYRAHPRLRTAAERMGLPPLPERRLNPYPQPMA